MVSQTNKDKTKAIWGEMWYVSLLERKGTRFCFVNNLKASSKGWTKPIKETLLGPKRLWNSPITLRSNKVKKATESKINKHWTNQQTRIIREYFVQISLVLKTKVLVKLIL